MFTPASLPITHAGVVIPARNEAALIGRGLEAVLLAAEQVSVPVHVVLVLDSCSDGTAAAIAHLAGESAWTTVLHASVASPGAARRIGAEYLLNRPRPDGLCWLVTTDADSSVPAHWLTGHLAHAEAGAVLVAGTVELDEDGDLPLDVRTQYERVYRRHLARDGHGHIHGANIGIREDAYGHLGGFRADVPNEDVDLVGRAEQNGIGVTWALDVAVRTSARTQGRAESGMAQHLTTLRVTP